MNLICALSRAKLLSFGLIERELIRDIIIRLDISIPLAIRSAILNIYFERNMYPRLVYVPLTRFGAEQRVEQAHHLCLIETGNVCGFYLVKLVHGGDR